MGRLFLRQVVFYVTVRRKLRKEGNPKKKPNESDRDTDKRGKVMKTHGTLPGI